MERKKLDIDGTAMSGLAAWALSKRLLSRLRAVGVITEQEGAIIIDEALSHLEGLAEHFESDAIHKARVLLEATQKNWPGESP